MPTTDTRPHDWRPVHPPHTLPQEDHADLGLVAPDQLAGGDV